MDTILTLDVPLSDMACDKCRSESGDGVTEVIPYVVTFLSLPGLDDKDPITVPIDVKRIEWRKESEGYYKTIAVVSLSCPNCDDPRSLRYLLEAPIMFLNNIGKCPTCGEQLMIENEEIVYEEVSELEPQIKVQGDMTCKNCGKSRPGKVEKVIRSTDFSVLKKNGSVQLDFANSLCLALPSQSKRTKVFISYSHQDQSWLEKLQIYLTPLERAGFIDCWDDTRISPGSKWRDEIAKALVTCKVAVLLVSPYFLASQFIVEHELSPLLKAAESEGLRILWVAVSPCLYKETEIGDFQAINDPTRPLDSLSRSDRGRVLVNICQAIKSAIEID